MTYKEMMAQQQKEEQEAEEKAEKMHDAGKYYPEKKNYYEYKIIDNEKTMKETENILNKYAKKGWELLFIRNTVNSDSIIFNLFLKREYFIK